ncbi:ATP-binding protein [Fundidesulfovibrio soli]|uniref:ATP-binding protein n=1 Tax=Fundidesulfovibrio soli TaxID=2922716 RepID=UPI001FAF13C2|nr:ATP-binding protein [Fundidesulfovibrio soli]
MPQQMTLHIDNRLQELTRLSATLEGFLNACSVTGRDAYHIQLALDELVTNIICYAYEGQGGHPIHVSLARTPEGLEIVLEDGGRPFNPLEAPEPDLDAPPETRPIGGLGIHFVRKTMDHLSYQREDGRNILRIHKNIT